MVTVSHHNTAVHDVNQVVKNINLNQSDGNFELP